jgi:lipoate-protein ligase A
MVRQMDTHISDYVMLYINTPCVVVGKNQSIYKEVNFEYLQQADSCIVRRVSGGGTVYHDQGNLCFAFLSKFDDKKVNNYKHFNQPIVDALQKAGVDARFNKRNDILWDEKKISGNAQFTDRKNILSHGTLLVNSDLDRLRMALKANPFTVESKAVSSVRSSVLNISEQSDAFPTAEDLRNYLIQEFDISGTYTFSDEEWESIQKNAGDKFQSDEWTYGRNPHTTIFRDGLSIEIEAGILDKVNAPDGPLSILTLLEGTYFTAEKIKAGIAELAADEDSRQKLFSYIF